MIRVMSDNKAGTYDWLQDYQIRRSGKFSIMIEHSFKWACFNLGKSQFIACPDETKDKTFDIYYQYFQGVGMSDIIFSFYSPIHIEEIMIIEDGKCWFKKYIKKPHGFALRAYLKNDTNRNKTGTVLTIERKYDGSHDSKDP